MNDVTSVRRGAVLYCLVNLYKGGSRVLHDSLVKELAARADAIIFTFDSPGNQRLKEKAKGRVLLIRYPWRSFNWAYRLLLEHLFVALVALATRSRRVVMFGNFPCAMWWGDQMVFFHNYNYIQSGDTSWRFSLERLLFYSLHRWKRARYLCQLEGMRTALKRVGIDAVATRIPEFLPISREQHRLSDTLKFIYPAFKYPAKNHQWLAAAYKILRRENCRVIVTISGADFESLFLGKEDVFSTVGELSHAEVLDLYRHCDAVIFPSISESLGYPLIEALAIGLPVLAPNLPYARQVLGSAGYYFDPFDPNSLASVLEEIRDWPSRAGARETQIQAIFCSPVEFINQLNA